MSKTATSTAINTTTTTSGSPSTILTGSTALQPGHQRPQQPPLQPSTISTTTTRVNPTAPSSTHAPPSPKNQHHQPSPHLLIRTPSATPPPLNPFSVKAFFQRYAHHIQAVLDGVISTSDLEESFFSFANESSRDDNPGGKRGVNIGTGTERKEGPGAWWLQSSAYQDVRKCHLEAVDVELDVRAQSQAAGTDAQRREAVAQARVKWSLYRERNGKGRGDVVVEEVYWVRQERREEMRISGVGVMEQE